MTDVDVERQQAPPARNLSKWLKDQLSSLGKSHPDANSLTSELGAIVTTTTSFGSLINNYAFQEEKVQLGLEITNAVTSLGTTAAEGIDAYVKGEVKNPYYIAANVASFALSVGRTAVDLAMEDGNNKETAKFAIDVAQMATQVAKWGTKPSAKKAKGEGYDELKQEVRSLQQEVESARSALASSSGSVHSWRSAPAGGAPNTPPAPETRQRRRASR
ncbi:hypothetical protein ACQPYA_14225 [Micromonospora sp. CA-263727]|uniref:hypothetical protein n=1 Tax=Micromonospora sp. CA-263727 TaxID=3239967 RepID=UPI003D8EE232